MQTTLTPRANLLRTLRGEQPEWIPVTGHCDPYNQPNKQGMDPVLAKALANVQWSDESTIAFSRHLGLDIMDWCGCRIRERHHKVEINTQKESTDRIVTIWRTPKGELRCVQQYSPDTGMWYTPEHAVKAGDDLERLACVYEDAEYYLTPEDLAFHRARHMLIGDDGIKLCTMMGGGTPLGQMIRVHAGVETTAYLYADARQEMHDLFNVMEAAHHRAVDLSLTFENDAIVSVDDTSTTCISPAMFEEFCLGYIDRMAAPVHAAGRFYFHHSCGLIHDLLPLYRRTKMDAVHAFTVPPIGDVTVAEGRTLLGPDITIIAGAGSILSSITTGKRAEVVSVIERIFRDAHPGGRFILNVAPEPVNTMDDMEFLIGECRKHQLIDDSEL